MIDGVDPRGHRAGQTGGQRTAGADADVREIALTFHLHRDRPGIDAFEVDEALHLGGQRRSAALGSRLHGPVTRRGHGVGVVAGL